MATPRPSLHLLPAALAVLALIPVVVLPLAYLVYGSTLDTESATGAGRVTFERFGEIAGNADYRQGILNSLKLAVATGVGSCIIGVLIAWIVVHVRPPGRNVIDALMIVPFFLSSFVLAIAWAMLGNPNNGLINGWISDLVGRDVVPLSMYSFWGIAFVIMTGTVPFVYMLTAAALGSTDPSLEEAAAMSGAGRVRRLRTVTLPLVAPSILAGVFFAVVFAMESFAEPAILGASIRYNTVLTDIYLAVENFPIKYGTASALAVVVMAITVVLVFVQGKLLGNRSFVSLSGKSGSGADISSGYGRRARLALLLIPVGYLVLAVVLPMLALALISLQPFASPQITELTLQNYEWFFSDEANLRALRNSGITSAAAAVASMLWMFVLAYALRRSRFWGSRVVGYVALLPIAVPGVVIGVALLWISLRSPVLIHGTLIIIALAYVARFSPFVLRSITAAMTQVDVALEESARMSGAGEGRVLRDIIFPLIRPSLLSGGVIFGLFSLRDLNTVVLLSGPTNNTISMQIWSMYENAQLPLVAATAVVQSSILLALVVLGRWLGRAPTVRSSTVDADEPEASYPSRREGGSPASLASPALARHGGR
ncbi:MAG: ABC transporter permease subunit [Micromonosporaceae bacterium]|nr:ABC transporter permease subunit [Micromonosporaceae bacterium]